MAQAIYDVGTYACRRAGLGAAATPPGADWSIKVRCRKEGRGPFF